MQSDSGSGKHRVASRAGRVTDIGELPDELVLLAEQLSDDAAHIAEQNPASDQSKIIMQRDAVQTYEQASAGCMPARRYGWSSAQVAAAVLLIAVGGWASGVLTSQWWTARQAATGNNAVDYALMQPADSTGRTGERPLVIPAAFIRSLSAVERSALADVVEDDEAEISFALR